MVRFPDIKDVSNEYPESVIQFIASYLEGLKSRVKVGNEIFTFRLAGARVVQGTLFSP